MTISDSDITKIILRSGFINDLTERNSCPEIILSAPDIPADILKQLLQDDYVSLKSWFKMYILGLTPISSFYSLLLQELLPVHNKYIPKPVRFISIAHDVTRHIRIVLLKRFQAGKLRCGNCLGPFDFISASELS